MNQTDKDKAVVTNPPVSTGNEDTKKGENRNI